LQASNVKRGPAWSFNSGAKNRQKDCAKLIVRRGRLETKKAFQSSEVKTKCGTRIVLLELRAGLIEDILKKIH